MASIESENKRRECNIFNASDVLKAINEEIEQIVSSPPFKINNYANNVYIILSLSSCIVAFLGNFYFTFPKHKNKLFYCVISYFICIIVNAWFSWYYMKGGTFLFKAADKIQYLVYPSFDIYTQNIKIEIRNKKKKACKAIVSKYISEYFNKEGILERQAIRKDFEQIFKDIKD